MSYWVELHCDVPLDQRDVADSDNILVNVCWTDRNASPSAKSASAGRAAKEACREAVRLGWQHSRDGQRWICPGCLKHGLSLSRKRGRPTIDEHRRKG